LAKDIGNGAALSEALFIKQSRKLKDAANRKRMRETLQKSSSWHQKLTGAWKRAGAFKHCLVRNLQNCSISVTYRSQQQYKNMSFGENKMETRFEACFVKCWYWSEWSRMTQMLPSILTRDFYALFNPDTLQDVQHLKRGLKLGCENLSHR